MKDKVNKLYRSKDDKIIAGVCGGIAEHFNVDPLWIRLSAVLLALIDGTGIILYIIAWILMPENPSQKSSKKTVAEETVEKITKKVDNKSEKISKTKEHKKKDGLFFGVMLIVVGVALFLRNVLDFQYVWPVILVGLGAYLILRGRK